MVLEKSKMKIWKTFDVANKIQNRIQKTFETSV